MGPRPSTLLGLVLCLGQMIHMQEGVQPKPSLRVEPGPVIPRGRPVTFVCRAPAGARLFRLLKDGRLVSSYQKSVSQDDSQGTETRFLMRAVNEHDAGSYRCLYNQGSHWSERSEPLQLQVTEEDVSTRPSGALPKPSLRAEPGPVIPRGRPVTFVCQGPAEAELFRLEKDKRQVVSDQKSVPQDGSQGTQARFLISKVNDDTAGSYRCLYNQGSNIWSERSEPLQLQVTEEDVSTRPSGALPKPSLRAEPGPVIPRGRPVTFVCQGPAGAELFRLEKDESQEVSNQKSVPQDGSQGTQARFFIPAVNEHTVGSYRCLYNQGSRWSERSEPLQLQVTEEDISTRPSGAAPVPSSTPSSTPNTHRETHSSGGLLRENVYILVRTSVAFLLCVLLLVLFLVHRQHQRKHKSIHGKGKEQRPQERLIQADDITESTPDEATVYALPEKKRELQSPSPAAGDAQEVTYAQLDQGALTLRAAQAVSPPPAEPTAAASTYAELPRR